MKVRSSTSNQPNWVIIGTIALSGALFFFRSRITPKNAILLLALTIFSTFYGFTCLGILGPVYGLFIAVLLTATVGIYFYLATKLTRIIAVEHII